MSELQNRSDTAARLVSRHLFSLVDDARKTGVPLEEVTIELAAHATCAALSFWTAEDLHSLIDVADDDEPLPGEVPVTIGHTVVIPLRRRMPC